MVKLIVSKDNDTIFEDLCIGEAFKYIAPQSYEPQYFMKIGPSTAICLSEGDVCSFDDDDIVYLVDIDIFVHD